MVETILFEEIFLFRYYPFREREKLGRCKDGKQYVDPQFLKILVNMGYNKEAARIALKETNNIISDSIQYIQEHPEAGPSGTRSTEVLALIEDRIPELVEAGFDSRMAKLALTKHAGKKGCFQII